MTSEEARLLRFAIEYPAWHSFARGNSPKTRAALLRLEASSLVRIIRHRAPAEWQFRLAHYAARAENGAAI
jgi:hypothetical protein